MEEIPPIATHQIQSATLKNIQMHLQGPTAHGRAAHLYIVRFLAQSYNEATRNTLLPVLLSAMRLAKVVMILTKLITSQPECVCKYQTTEISVVPNP